MKTNDFEVISCDAWIAIFRFILYQLSTDGGQKLSQTSFDELNFIKDTKRIAREFTFEKN